MDHKSAVRTFLVGELIGGDKPNVEQLTDETSLVKSGLIDSIGLVKLLGFIETTFKISIVDDRLQTEDFETVNSIHALICRKLEAGIADPANRVASH